MDRRAAIAILSHDLAASGVVRNGVRIANRAAEKGMATEYWVINRHGALASDLHPGIRIVQIGPSILSRLPRRPAGLLSLPWLVNRIKQERPGILFSAGNHFHLTASLGYRLAGKPSDVRFAGRASNAVPGPERLGKLAYPLQAIFNTFEKLKYQGMNPVIAVAEELATGLAGAGISQAVIKVIPNGVDILKINEMAGAKLEHPWFDGRGVPVIIAAGRICRQKDFELLIQAFAIARKSKALRLMIIGGGSPSAISKLEKLAARLGIGNDLRLEGFQPNPFAFFAKARLFVLSSRWEGMSNVLLEAMATGLPVVAVAAPTGTREIIQEGKWGHLVQSREPEALAAAMLEALAKPPNRQKMQNRAGMFSLEETLAAYEKLLFDTKQ